MKLLAIGILLCATAEIVFCESHNVGDLLNNSNNVQYATLTAEKSDPAEIKESFETVEIYPKYLNVTPNDYAYIRIGGPKAEYEKGNQKLRPNHLKNFSLYYDDPDRSHRYTLVMKDIDSKEANLWLVTNINGTYGGYTISPYPEFSKHSGKGVHRLVALFLDQKDQYNRIAGLKKNLKKLIKLDLSNLIKLLGPPAFGLYLLVKYSSP